MCFNKDIEIFLDVLNLKLLILRLDLLNFD